MFAEVNDVKRMVVECINGSHGFFSNLLECTANVVSGILMFERFSSGTTYIAIDEKADVQLTSSQNNRYYLIH